MMPIQAVFDTDDRTPDVSENRIDPMSKLSLHVIRFAVLICFSLAFYSCATSSDKLHQAAFRGNGPEVEALLLDGTDPNRRGQPVPGSQWVNSTALHSAVSGDGDIAIVVALLEKGARVNAINLWDGQTPLHHAVAQSAPLDVVATLLAFGADVNARIVEGAFGDWTDDVGLTALHLAARDHDDSDVVSLLIQHGSIVDQLAYRLAEQNVDADRGAIAKKLSLSGIPRDEEAIAQILEEERMADVNTEDDGFNWGKAVAIAGIAAVGATAVDAGVPVEDVVEVAGAAVADIVGETGGENLAQVSGNQTTAPGTGPSAGAGRTGTAQEPRGFASATSGECEVPGFEEEDLSAFDAENTGLSWCPADVGFQSRAQALNVELSRCMFTLGRVTMATIASHRANIQDSCEILEAMAPDRCQCPSSYYELGRD